MPNIRLSGNPIASLAAGIRLLVEMRNLGQPIAVNIQITDDIERQCLLQLQSLSTPVLFIDNALSIIDLIQPPFSGSSRFSYLKGSQSSSLLVAQSDNQYSVALDYNRGSLVSRQIFTHLRSEGKMRAALLQFGAYIGLSFEPFWVDLLFNDSLEPDDSYRQFAVFRQLRSQRDWTRGTDISAFTNLLDVLDQEEPGSALHATIAQWVEMLQNLPERILLPQDLEENIALNMNILEWACSRPTGDVCVFDEMKSRYLLLGGQIYTQQLPATEIVTDAEIRSWTDFLSLLHVGLNAALDLKAQQLNAEH